MHCAVSFCEDERILLELLNNPGINVNIPNNDANTPLHYLCQNFSSPDFQEILERFMELGVDVNKQNRNLETPLHKAMFNNKLRGLMVRLLISNGADVNKTTKQGDTGAFISFMNFNSIHYFF